MIDRKLKTESCTICDESGCADCCFNKELKNNFTPNAQTTLLIQDGYLDGNDIAVIHQMTMKKRVWGDEEEEKNGSGVKRLSD